MKKIDGTWFEFQHMFPVEGKYWNNDCAKFTKAMWRDKISEMRELGMEYLVCMASALDGKAFFRSNILPQYNLECSDCLETLYSTADEYGMKVFMGNDFIGDWANPERMIRDPELIRLRDAFTEEVATKYAGHKSFYGWYWPNEAEINPYYSEDFISYVNHNSKLADSLTPGKKKLIAPYGTCILKADDYYIRQLDRLNVDMVAYQDEIGVRKTTVEDTARWYENLKKAHDKSGRNALWADIEIFEFEGDVYKSALCPSRMARISRQIDNVAPFVDKILVYQYLGIMSKPGSSAKTSHPDAEMYYMEYRNWLESEKLI